MKRYDIEPFDGDLIEDSQGDFVKYEAIAPLIEAVDNLLSAKGSFHNQYNELFAARRALEKAE